MFAGTFMALRSVIDSHLRISSTDFKERLHIDFERGHRVVKAEEADNFVDRTIRSATESLEAVC
jgi:hypothetical protein